MGWYCIRLGIIAFNQGRDEAIFSSDAASADAIWPLHCTAKCNNWNEERVPLDCEAVVCIHATIFYGKKRYRFFPTASFNPYGFKS